MGPAVVTRLAPSFGVEARSYGRMESNGQNGRGGPPGVYEQVGCRAIYGGRSREARCASLTRSTKGERRCLIHGNRDREMVQRREGLRLHRAQRRQERTSTSTTATSPATGSRPSPRTRRSSSRRASNRRAPRQPTRSRSRRLGSAAPGFGPGRGRTTSHENGEQGDGHRRGREDRDGGRGVGSLSERHVRRRARQRPRADRLHGGKMRRYRIRVNPGDRIKVELSPYDSTAASYLPTAEPLSSWAATRSYRFFPLRPRAPGFCCTIIP